MGRPPGKHGSFSTPASMARPFRGSGSHTERQDSLPVHHRRLFERSFWKIGRRRCNCRRRGEFGLGCDGWYGGCGHDGHVADQYPGPQHGCTGRLADRRSGRPERWRGYCPQRASDRGERLWRGLARTPRRIWPIALKARRFAPAGRKGFSPISFCGGAVWRIWRGTHAPTRSQQQR